MKYQPILPFLFISIFFSSCYEKVESKKVVVIEETSNLGTIGEHIFISESDSIYQKLIVSYLDSNTITYKVIASSKLVDCRQVLEGKAVNKYPDLDPDLDGFAYSAIKYYDSQNDRIAIRIQCHTIELARLEVPETSDSIEFCQKLFNGELMIKQSP